MKKGITVLLLSLVSLCSVGAAVTSTIAWFSADKATDNVEGGAIASYFESGTGDAADDPSTENIVEGPYIISSRNHLYNLAWLQYIGYFNDSTNFQGIKQCYFKIKNDIDMEGITIPPIGTEKYPFLGHFDGNGKTISNFTISNDNPASDNSDFGVAKPANLFGGEVSDAIGFFGVVGDPTDTISHTSSIVSVSDVKLDNFTVRSRTSQTLIGLAAGYCEGTLSKVKVGTSHISTNGQTHTAYTDNLSDYGLVGYVPETLKDTSDVANAYQQDVSQFYHYGGSGGGGSGQEDEWGGSFNSKEYTTWFYDSFNSNPSTSSSGNTKTVNNEYKLFYTTSTLVPPISFFNYVNANTSSNYYSFNKDYTGLYRNGNTRVTFTWEYDNNAYNQDYCKGVKITLSSSVTISGNSYSVIYLHNHGGDTNPERIYQYKTSNGSGATSGKNNLINTSYFRLDQEAIYRFKNTSYVPLMFSDNTKSATGSNNTGYIVGTNIGTAANASPKVASYEMRFINNSISDTNVSYSDIYKGKGEFDYVDSNLEVLTYNGTNWVCIKDSHNSNHTKSNSALSSYNKNDNTTPAALGFEKYNDSRDSLQTIFEENTRLHGIHFDSDFTGTTPNNRIGDYNEADTNNTTKGLSVASGIKINGATYNSTYYLPKGSIDFNLKKTGIINFFAGTYSTTTSVTNFNFFSVYQVLRASSAPYTYTVKEINKVYRNKYWDPSRESNSETNPKYFYQYNTNPASYSNIIDGNGTTRAATENDRDTDAGTDGVEFNVSIFRTAAPVNNALYYFEIPVNDGEFAMGFVSSATSTTQQGAYLIYLDIGANGDVVASDEITAYAITTFNTTSQTYPLGVDFATSDLSQSIPGGETLGIIISENSSGVVNFSINNATISYSSDYETTYAYSNKQVIPLGSNAPPKQNDVIKTTVGTRIINCQIVEVSDSSVWNIIISYDLSTETYTYESISKGSVPKTEQQLPSSFTSVVDAIKTQVSTPIVSLTRTSGSNTFNAVPNYFDNPYTTVAITVDLTGIEISAHDKAAGYTISINGTVMNTDPKTYPVS